MDRGRESEIARERERDGWTEGEMSTRERETMRGSDGACGIERWS